MKIFITGRPASGKTTLILKLLDFLKGKNVKVGGFITKEIRAKGQRVGFEMVDLSSGKEGILAHVNVKSPLRVSKYGINLEILNRIGVKSLEEALNGKFDLLVVDEIGRMELLSKEFRRKLQEILSSDIRLVATLHLKFVKEFGKFGEVIYLEREKFDEILELIKSEVSKMFGLSEESG